MVDDSYFRVSNSVPAVLRQAIDSNLSYLEWRHNEHNSVSNHQRLDCSGADQRKYQISASLAFVRGIQRWPVNSPHKGPVTWKMFTFDVVVMYKHFSWISDCHTISSAFQGNFTYHKFNPHNLNRKIKTFRFTRDRWSQWYGCMAVIYITYYQR